MEASDIRLMKGLEAENARLKQMYAELSLENKVLIYVIEKLKPAQRREFVAIKRACMSIRRACAVFNVSRNCYVYVPMSPDDSEVITALVKLAGRKPNWGFNKLFCVLRRRGHPWSHKRVWRVYCLLKTNLKRKGKKHLLRSARETLAQPLAPNFCWSIDFMRGTLWSGRTFRTFNASVCSTAWTRPAR